MSEKIGELYNRVSDSYNQSQSQLILQQANAQAFKKMTAQGTQLDKILSLGIGDGAYVVPYAKQFNEAEVFGLDISSKMLEKAQKNLQFTAFLGDISKAKNIIDHTDFDLVMAHFVLAYIPLETILSQVNQLIAPSGYFSIVTNLSSSFQNGMTILEKMGRSRNPINKMLFNHLQEVLDALQMPNTVDEICATVQASGYTVVAADSLSLPIQLNTLDEMETFFINGGWFVSGLVHDYIPSNMVLFFVRRAIKHFLSLPYQDTADIAVVLARKMNL